MTEVGPLCSKECCIVLVNPVNKCQQQEDWELAQGAYNLIRSSLNNFKAKQRARRQKGREEELKEIQLLLRIINCRVGGECVVD